jgi:arabinogalactan oligomer/maltooligosaccharide transport system permease protein
MSSITSSARKQGATTAESLSLVWAFFAAAVALALLFLGAYLLVAPPPRRELTVTAPRTVGALLLLVAGAAVLLRYARVLRHFFTVERDYEALLTTARADLVQVFLLTVLASVIFPIIWIISMSLDPRDFSRPSGLTIVPPGASLEAYATVLTTPSPNPVTFPRLLVNSLLVAGGTAALAVALGTTAAYAFSRFAFPGRRVGMLGFVLVLMIPPGGTLAPLFVLLNAVGLRTSLWGLAIAYASSALPFAIWNMKGFIDALPYDLEEAAQIDGCNRTQSFIHVILPLALPGMAVTALWGFLTGWSEFILAWTFLVDPKTFTLPMVLRGMVGQYAAGTSWSAFSAMSIVMSIPAVLVFFFLQRYLVSGLAAGGVKG